MILNSTQRKEHIAVIFDCRPSTILTLNILLLAFFFAYKWQFQIVFLCMRMNNVNAISIFRKSIKIFISLLRIAL